jgi:hypothetical protein
MRRLPAFSLLVMSPDGAIARRRGYGRSRSSRRAEPRVRKESRKSYQANQIFDPRGIVEWPVLGVAPALGAIATSFLDEHGGTTAATLSIGQRGRDPTSGFIARS